MAVKRAFHICRIHMAQVFRAPMIYAYFLLFFLFFYQANRPMVRLQNETDLLVNALGYTVGAFSSGSVALSFGFGCILIFSDLPRFQENTLFESLRCTRRQWMGGRIMYVVCMAFIYTLWMVLMCMLTVCGEYSLSGGWGKLLYTIANGYAIGSESINIELTKEIVQLFSPLSALAHTTGMCFLVAIFIGLMQLALTMFMSRAVALTLTSIVCVMDMVISMRLPYAWVQYSPISWVRLTVLTCSNMPDYPSQKQALITLVGLILLCLVLCFLSAQRAKSFSDRLLKQQD